jgi:uncharacterized membrane protein
MIRPMFCNKCGTEISADAQFCTACGTPLPEAGGLIVAPAAPWMPPETVQVQASRWIGQGWVLVQSDMGSYILLSLIFLVLTSAVPIVLHGPLIAGMHIFTTKKLLGRRAEVADLFTGFNFFLPTFVASLLIALFVSIGMILCIIPGLVLTAMYSFTYLFIVDKRMDFWAAMQASHEVVKRDYFGFTMFVVLMLLVNLLGLLCCVVGLLVSVPVTWAAITVAYNELVGFEPVTAEAL